MKKMMNMAFVAVMGMMMSVNAKASTVTPASAAEMNEMASIETTVNPGEQLESRTMIYIDGEKTNKFVYVIGTDGVVRSKTMYRQNNSTHEWIPVCCYRAYYGDDANVIVCGNWNESDHAYTSDVMRASYSKSECPVLFKLPFVLDY